MKKLNKEDEYTTSSQKGLTDIGSSMNYFKIIEHLGNGGFGVVYKVKSLKNFEFYVVKNILLNQLTNSEQGSALNEVLMLKKISHPNIIQYINSFIENNILNIVMEYASGGDLQKVNIKS